MQLGKGCEAGTRKESPGVLCPWAFGTRRRDVCTGVRKYPQSRAHWMEMCEQETLGRVLLWLTERTEQGYLEQE